MGKDSTFSREYAKNLKRGKEKDPIQAAAPKGEKTAADAVHPRAREIGVQEPILSTISFKE